MFRGGRIAAICLLLAVVHTWPLATAPGTLSRNDNADAELNEWIMAWVAHQLPRAPAHLFDGNIFYPERDSLAFSEPLIVPALMGAPLHWLGVSPVLVFNIVLILGFALTAWAGFTLAFAWTGDRAAGFLAGSMFAFNTHTLTRLAHVQGIHAWGLPLALLSADRDPRTRPLARRPLAGGLDDGDGVHLRLSHRLRHGDDRGRPARARARLAGLVPVVSPCCFGGAAVLAGVAVIPVYLPYRRVARLGMVRSIESVTEFSATLKGYLAAAGRIHFSTWSGGSGPTPSTRSSPASSSLSWPSPRSLGFATRRQSRLTCTGAASAIALDRRRVVMLIAIAVTGVLLSLGTRTPVYGWVYQVFPPMQGLRAASRFGNLFLLAMAVLAAYGLASLRRRLPPLRAGAIVVALVVVANIESLRAPLHYTRFTGIPPIYSLLAKEPGRVVLVEVPFYPPQGVFENGTYVLNSTAHWRSLMNGYSGYTPEAYENTQKPSGTSRAGTPFKRCERPAQPTS